MDRDVVLFNALMISLGHMVMMIVWFIAILIFIVFVFLTLPTIKKIKKRTGKLIDKGIAAEKNVRISAILSIIIPGLGQIYNGEALRGVLYTILGVLYIILIGCSGIFAMIGFKYGVRMMIISGLIYVIIEIICSIDAYRMAVNINKSLVEHERVLLKKCPFCAEMVKNEEIVCKHCGSNFEQ